MQKSSHLVREAQNFVFPLLEKHCAHYPFHNPSHTRSVFERSTYLALAENINSTDLEDLQIASIFHDTGFIEQYPKNEYIGAQIARHWLEEAGHPEERIEKIESLIMATVLFSHAKNTLEGIIQDADLDNIGTESAFAFSQSLLRELREVAHIELSDCAYWQFTYRVHNNFSFHTHTAQNERNRQKVLNVKHLESYLTMLDCEVPRGYDNLDKIV